MLCVFCSVWIKVVILKYLKLLFYCFIAFLICWYLATLHITVYNLNKKLDSVPQNVNEKLDLLLYLNHVQALDCT